MQLAVQDVMRLIDHVIVNCIFKALVIAIQTVKLRIEVGSATRDGICDAVNDLESFFSCFMTRLNGWNHRTVFAT